MHWYFREMVLCAGRKSIYPSSFNHTLFNQSGYPLQDNPGDSQLLSKTLSSLSSLHWQVTSSHKTIRISKFNAIATARVWTSPPRSLTSSQVPGAFEFSPRRRQLSAWIDCQCAARPGRRFVVNTGRSSCEIDRVPPVGVHQKDIIFSSTT